MFGAVFALGRAAAIQAAERVGGRILEVGVGTGISLPDYSRNNRLFGVDICEPMLRKAKERVAAQAPLPCGDAGGDGRDAGSPSPTPPSTWWWRSS